MTGLRYIDVCGKGVLNASRKRRERLLVLLRWNPMLLTEVIEAMRRDEPDYSDHQAGKDLRELERYGLAWSSGHPKRWQARASDAVTPEEVAAKLLAAIERFERAGFGTSRTPGALTVLGELRPELVGPGSELDHRLDNLQVRMRAFIEAGRKEQA